MSRRIHVVMDKELLAQIDRAKGLGQSRGDFIRRTLEKALGTSEPGGQSVSSGQGRSPGSKPDGTGSTPGRSAVSPVSGTPARSTEPAPSRASKLGKGSFSPRPKG